jgi:tRNA dimethylallyltransferase
MNSQGNSIGKPKIIAVVGATASGKTAYSVELASQLDGEIISADSRLVYKGFDIACAKPSEQEKKGIPHHMMDIVEPEFDYSAGLFAKEANKKIYEILARGKTPIIAGGTGLYFRLLLENYEPPKVEPDYALREKLKNLSAEKLYEMLFDLDKSAVRAIESKNDKKKLIRTIEIVKNGGQPLYKQRGVRTESEFDVEWVGLNYPRDVLYDRINRRVDLMFQAGIIDETKYLLKKHGRIPNLVCTIGYKEIIGYLDGEYSVEDAAEKLKQNTRRYAKRQLTWFRKNPNIKWNYYPEILSK